MNPEIEPMLEESFEGMEPTTTKVGRVAVEPDYESGLTNADVPQVKAELEKLLGSVTISEEALQSHDGQDLDFSMFPTLKKYVRRISLHGGEADTPWVEVVPPGNWI